MKKILLSLFVTCWIPLANAGLGLNYGFGLPYVTQLGVNYTMGSSLTLHAGQNSLSFSSGLASVELSMPEVSALWHVFDGSFFLGAGVGSQSFKATATELFTAQTASVDVTSTVILFKGGWMWGKSDGGLWFGIDFTMVSPTSTDYEIIAPGVSTTDQVYKDAEKQAKTFASTSYTNLTVARIGYLF